ncbi:MAG: sigma-70 family RNA polymerase sigma factor [Myxococcota bacterium]
MKPKPSSRALRRVIRRALKQGVPAPDAEDLATAAWERAAERYDRDRGSFDAFFEQVGRTVVQDWWRKVKRRREFHLAEEPVAPPDNARLEQVFANQQRLLEALADDERDVFLTWALQKHLPQGQLTAPEAARRLGLTVADFNNAKRRLADRIRKLAASWGLEPRDFFSVNDREGPRRRNHVHG